MRLITGFAAALLLAACSSAAPPATSGPTGSAAATSAATSGPTLAPSTVEPTISPATAAPPATPAGGGGVVGPVFAGPLNEAFPPVMGGQQVQVFGPTPGSELENLDATIAQLASDLGLDLEDVEAAFATDSGASVIVFAVRFPGVDSATLDSDYITLQESAPGTSNFRVVPVAGRNVHAFDTMIGTTYSWVNGDILFTVFGGEPGATQAIASMPLPTVALQAGGEVTADALVDLTITGGEHAGSYHGETSVGGCSRNALAANSFGLQYTDDANAQGFTSLQMVVEDAAAAEAGGTDAFFATVQIGLMSSGTSYNLDPQDGDGTGTVTITPNGNDAAVAQISGETADGVGIEATVTCNVVFDLGAE